MKKWFANVDLFKLVAGVERTAELVLSVIKHARERKRERESAQAVQGGENTPE